jgi:hypothetical protein
MVSIPGGLISYLLLLSNTVAMDVVRDLHDFLHIRYWISIDRQGLCAPDLGKTRGEIVETAALRNGELRFKYPKYHKIVEITFIWQ